METSKYRLIFEGNYAIDLVFQFWLKYDGIVIFSGNIHSFPLSSIMNFVIIPLDRNRKASSPYEVEIIFFDF